MLPGLWRFNLAKIIVVDVTDDYQYMQQPLPTDWYPVLREVWVQPTNLDQELVHLTLVDGYLYDWHLTPEVEGDPWYVGVVNRNLLPSSKES